jgi:type II secretory pathway component HofQ
VITDILAVLTAERDKLNQAIAILQGSGVPKRRGRPPKNPLAALMALTAPASAARPNAKLARPKRTKAQREAQAERMRKYWAARKKRGA